ncbi:hypothetical protein OG426_35935 [Streptomyces canus]|uniref:hypothetical protein n=1 Tax=Streptomyces canus TaxID=58343 RepID=UPI00387098CE|nr:hypothetical protein OG426_35935 [Streptomyces canus]
MTAALPLPPPPESAVPGPCPSARLRRPGTHGRAHEGLDPRGGHIIVSGRPIDQASVSDAIDWIERIALAVAHVLDDQG